ncbi:MAG: TetR family transcriptional regulator [Spirochaetaceae bacterium]|jgi:AcrR family transcriptional regulator|nr:TetR family transcriptional regulator [Spirochaetaceae bacterium]
MLQKRKNKAVERSESWMFEALMKLLEEKPWADIGVSDITARAGVARSTFYRHYVRKEDVVVQGIDALIFDELMRKLQESYHERQPHPLVIYFETLMKYRDSITVLLKNDLTHLFDSFVDRLETFIMDRYGKTLPPEELTCFQYAVEFQLGGLFHIARHWVQNLPSPLTPYEMSAIFEDFLRPFTMQQYGIVEILRRCMD